MVLLREPEEGRPKDSDPRLRVPLVVASAGRAGLSSKRRRCVRLPWHRCTAVVATGGQAHTWEAPLWWLWIACQGMACHQVVEPSAWGSTHAEPRFGSPGLPSRAWGAVSCWD